MNTRMLAAVLSSLLLAAGATAQVFPPPPRIAAPSRDYPAGLFKIAQFHYDATREPKGWDWYLKSREGEAIIGAVAVYFGVNPAYITAAIGNTPGYSSQGEQTDYNVLLPAGYAFCAARVSVISIVPADGERASTVNAAASNTELRVSTWTPERHAWEGRSWAEGDAQIIGIKPEYLQEFTQKKVCAPVDDAGKGFLSCRGRGCEAGGEIGTVATAGPSTPQLQVKPGF